METKAAHTLAKGLEARAWMTQAFSAEVPKLKRAVDFACPRVRICRDNIGGGMLKFLLKNIPYIQNKIQKRSLSSLLSPPLVVVPAPPPE